MNCQDISLFLDDCDVRQLPEAQLAAVEEHLLTCADCANEWHAHQLVVRGRFPEMASDLPARVWSLVEKAGINKAGKRCGRTPVLGGLLLVGAAAAMMGWHSLRQGSATPGAVAVPAGMPGDSTITATASHAPSEASPATQEASPRFTVVVESLTMDSQEPAARAAVEAFHAALVDALRGVPDLIALNEGDRILSATPADYVVSVTGLAHTVDSSGAVAFQPTSSAIRIRSGAGEVSVEGLVAQLELERDHGGYASAMDEMDLGFLPGVTFPVEVKVKSGRSVVSTQIFPVGGESVHGGRNCRLPPTVARLDLPGYCMAPRQLAERQVYRLRLKAFPPNAALRQLLIDQLRGTSPRSEDRARSLQDLLQLHKAGRGQQLDATVIAAILDYASSLPSARRAMVWNELRGHSHPDLLPPLVASMLRDIDANSRLFALITLEAGFPSDATFRQALATAVQLEPAAQVREAARSALYSAAEWQRLAEDALANTNLSYDARLAPLRVGVAGTANQARAWQELRGDPQFVGELIDLIGKHMDEPAAEMATAGVLPLLEDVDDPAAASLFLRIIERSSQPGFTAGMAAAAMPWILKHRNDPTVRAKLNEGQSALRTAVKQHEEDISRQIKSE